MRRVVWSLTLLVLLAGLVPAAGPATQGLAPAALAQQAPLDEEIVLLDSNGRIVVLDPYVPSGIQRVEWQSDSTGWQMVATGDFNGDGDAEIIALRGGEARVFDPVVQPGRPEVQFSQVIAGQVWRLVATGNIDADPQDEIILTRSTAEGGVVDRILAFDPNADGTSWTIVFNEGYGAPWQRLVTGDVDGDGQDEVVAIRNVANPPERRIIIWDPGLNWQTIYNKGDFNFPWLAVDVANVAADATNREELVLTRQDVIAALPSFLVFRWTAVNADLQDVASEKYFPYFTAIATGDVNASGDEEIFLLRSITDPRPAMIIVNLGTDPTIPFEVLPGEERWRKVHAGDVDGDGRAEVVVSAANEYRVFTQPGANTNFDSFPGSYLSTGEFALGNVDGPGRYLGPALGLSRTTITLTLVAGQAASEAVNITNTSAIGTVPWSAAVIQGGEWLSVNPTSGVAPSTLNLVISTRNLLAGSYVGKVRVTAAAGVANSPQEITVNLTVNAPPFSVTPEVLSWFHIQGQPAPTQTVFVRGQGVQWAAGLVPISALATVEKAIQAGGTLKLADGKLVIEGAEPQVVPIVDWVDVLPQQGTATTDGSPVLVSLVPARVPHGGSEAALVFVALQTASPPAVVTRVRVLSAGSRSELHFLPLVE